MSSQALNVFCILISRNSGHIVVFDAFGVYFLCQNNVDRVKK